MASSHAVGVDGQVTAQHAQQGHVGAAAVGQRELADVSRVQSARRPGAAAADCFDLIFGQHQQGNRPRPGKPWG